MSLVGSRKIWFAQILYLSALRFIRVRCTICASSLTTVTMISIVPVMAFLFSVAKGFGGYQKLHTEVIVPGINQWFGASDVPELRKAIDYLLLFVEETDLSNLGVVGFVTVCYALIRLLGAVETIFNDLWRINSSRPFVRKIADYLTVSVVVPIVLFFSASISAAAKSYHLSAFLSQEIAWWEQSTIIELLTVPLLWITFGFSYFFLPNTRVKPTAAIIGGIVGGSLWIIFHHVHVSLQIGVANYNALYAGFSAFPIFMLWIFLSWIAVLVGASCAAAIQTREEHRDYVIRENLSVRDREWIAFQVGLALTKSFVTEKPCSTRERLEQEVNESYAAIRAVLSDLKQAGIAEETKSGGAMLVRDPAKITLYDILDSIRGRFYPIEGHSQKEELQSAKKDLLTRVRNKETVVLTKEDSHWMDSASLHLQENGLVEVKKGNEIIATSTLTLYDQFQMLNDTIAQTTQQYSLLSLYKEHIKDENQSNEPKNITKEV